MAIDFPDTPAVDDVYTVDDRSWKWNGVYWEAVATTGPTGPTGPDGSFLVSDTAPTGPVEGDVWYNSTTGQQFVYYDSYWVESAASVIGPTGPTGLTGETGATGPTGPTGPAGVTTGLVSQTNGTVTTASTSSTVVRNITLSTSDPSGGIDGDVWLKYTA
jgi:hypothetical protein